MMWIWSHRPRFLHLGLFFAAYVLGGGFAQSLAIVPGTGISIWPPSGLFIATLVLAPRRTWPWWVLSGCAAELVGNVLWFDSPLPAALLIYAGNALEAMTGAWLINRALGRPVRQETLQDVLVFIALGAGVAPVAAATVGAATVAWFGIQSQTFGGAWPLFWIGDATGVLIVAPLAQAMFQNWRGKAQLSAVRWVEVGLVALIFLAAAAFALSGYLPFAYIIMPPLLWAAVRFEFKGAAVALALLALVTAAFTISGASQFAGDPASQREKQIMLHLFLAVSALSAFIVAAISRQHLDDQVRAEEALRNSKAQFEQMLDAVPINILSFSPTGRLTYASKRYLEQVGSPTEDIQDFDALALDLAHPEDFPEMLRRASEGFTTGQPFVNRFRRRCRDGFYRWIEARAQPLHDADGAIVQWYIASIDIEDEMRAHKALRERERALRQLVETLPAMIDCAAPNGEPVYRSRQLREFLGYELETLDGAGKSRLDGTLDAGVHPDDIEGVKEHYGHSLATGEPYRRKHRLRRFDGEYLWVDTRAAPMRNAEGAIVQWNVICLDIDGEVRAQEELRLAQEKMARASQAASLAELSASIAHEVNQPLAAIVATSHACRRWMSSDPPNLERAKVTLERIIRDANSASEVVSRIRALFSQLDRARTPIAMTEVIGEVRQLMADELAIKNIRVETEFDRGLPPVLIDRVQMQQVLVNLIRNATDAMETIGDGARIMRLRAVLDGDHAIRIEVRDAGAGMQEPERVFEPFFTTKRNGMGMGLAICRSIIESHNGRLWAASNEPRETTLAFTLPTQDGEAT